MSKVKLELDKLTNEEIVNLAETIITNMTGNANFTTPNPTLADLTTAKALALNKINNANNKRQQSENATVQEGSAISSLKSLLTLEASYVDNESGGDADKITSAGMAVRSTASPKPIPEKVTDLNLTQGDDEGEVDLIWHPQTKFVSTYSIRYTYGNIDTPDWQNAPVSPTKSKYTLTGLTKGQQVWIEVAGNNAQGKGGWSDPAVIYVP
ncbi:MAG TPA: fibronectin type III domain-containing protein [Chitinophagales bacterium]|nr:fibronectin type III domain-containing protein [Chitinophagales bacterium]